MSSADLERQLTEFAEALIARASEKDTKLEDSVKVFKEVRELLSILTRGQEAGDKPSGRRSTTMNGLRARVRKAGGDGDGRSAPSVQDAIC